MASQGKGQSLFWNRSWNGSGTQPRRLASLLDETFIYWEVIEKAFQLIPDLFVEPRIVEQNHGLVRQQFVVKGEAYREVWDLRAQ